MENKVKSEHYGFARCSTRKQDVEYEIKALMDKGIKKENIFIEYESGAKTKEQREIFNSLLNKLQSQDQLSITEITRYCRNMRDLIDLIEMVQERKIILNVGSLKIDCRNEMLDPMTEVTLLVIGMFGQFDLKIKKYQIQLGLENAIAKGKVLGRPKTTKNDIPDVFYKYYPMYKNKSLSKLAFANVCNLSYPSIYKYIELVEQK